MRGTRAVLLLAAALFAWNLWGTDLWAPDEPYFGEGAREMVVDGQWAVPHVNGAVTTDKPPLFFWLIAFFSLPMGAVSSLTARLPSALAALGTVALTLRLGRRMAGTEAKGLAGLFACTNYMIWEKARSSQIDSLLTLLILVALSAFEAYRAGDASGKRAGLLFWLAASLAVLAKGPVGILLPLGVALVTLAFDRNLGAWRRFAPWAGPAVFASVVGGWMVLATIGGHGEYSVWQAFREHALNRAVHGLHHRQPPWYYLEILPIQLLPWSGLIPGALALAWKRRDRADRLLLIWSLFVVFFFSISTEKRDLYVLPAYPAFFLMAARFIRWLVAPESSVAVPGLRWFVIPHAFFGFVVGSAGVALPFLNQRSGTLPAASALALAVPLALAGIVSGIAALRGRVRFSLTAIGAGAVSSYLVLAGIVYPEMNAVKSARSLATSIRDKTADARATGRKVLAYRLGNLPEAIAFYSNGVYLGETSDEAELQAHLAGPPPRFVVIESEQLDAIPAGLLQELRILDSAVLARRTVHLIESTSP